MRRVVVALIVGAIAVILVFHGRHDAPDQEAGLPIATAAPTAAAAPPPDIPPTPSASATPTTTDAPYSGSADAKKAWEPVAEGFALAYVDTGHLTSKEWLANLKPYLAPDVIDELAGTDLEKVPDGHYAGYQVLRQADETLTVRVTYQEGWALVLYLVAVDDRTYIIGSFDYTEDFD